MAEPITVKDVARAAKVSVGTVSRVLRGEPSVRPETEIRVREAVERLNYTRLRRPKTTTTLRDASRNVTLLLLGMDRTLSNLPCVADAIHGAECALAQAGARVTLVDLPDVDHLPDSLGPREKVHGLLLKGALQGQLIERCDPTLRRRIRSLPTVWVLGRPPGADWGDVVDSQDDEVGRLAADHVVERGHREVAVFNPKPDQVLLARRSASFQWHAARGGANVQCILGEPSEWTLPLETVQDIDAVDRLLDRLWSVTPRPTAVFVPADGIAATIYRACARRGVRIGEELSLVSCNHELPLLAGLHPELTTVDIGAAAIGRQAAHQLLWRMEHLAEPHLSVAIQPRLIEGQSVARL